MRMSRLAVFGRPIVAAALLLTTTLSTAQGDELLEQQKRLNAVAAQELDTEAARTLREAFVEAKKDPTRAAEMLRSFLPRLQQDKLLPEARRRSLLEAYESRLRTLEGREQTLGTTASEVARGAARDRQEQLTQDAARAEELRRLMLQKSELLRQGKYDEVAKLGEDASRRFGNLPAIESFRRTSSAQERLSELQRIRNERDQRYNVAMRRLVESSMPIVGDLEFPKDWAEKTKRRLKVQLTELEQKIIKALNTPITASVKDKPLPSMLDYIEKTTGLPITIDRAAMEAAQIGYETPVTFEARGTSLRTSLRSMLSQIGLTYVIRKEAVLITTPQQASQLLVTKTYYVGDLISGTAFPFDPVASQINQVQNIAGLIAYVQSIEPTSWREGGGAGTIAFVPAAWSIVVRQSAEMQYVLQGLLK